MNKKAEDITVAVALTELLKHNQDECQAVFSCKSTMLQTLHDRITQHSVLIIKIVAMEEVQKHHHQKKALCLLFCSASTIMQI